jgi:chromosome segregation ATPase
MGDWKGRHFALEQDLQEANGRLRLFSERNNRLDAQNVALAATLEKTQAELSAVHKGLAESEKVSASRLSVVHQYQAQIKTLIESSKLLTNSCASLRTANNQLRLQLDGERVRLTPVLPPLPLPLVCSQAHTNLAELERAQALRKENDEQRKIIADLRQSHEITTQTLGGCRRVIDDLRLDNGQLVSRIHELDNKMADLMYDPPLDTGQIHRLHTEIHRLHTANSILVREVTELTRRCKELKDMLIDVQDFVEALDRK